MAVDRSVDRKIAASLDDIFLDRCSSSFRELDWQLAKIIGKQTGMDTLHDIPYEPLPLHLWKFGDPSVVPIA